MTPRTGLRRIDTEPLGMLGIGVARLGCRLQVALGHQVGEHIVVHDAGVLVRSGHAEEVEQAVVVAMHSARPHAGRFDEDVDSVDCGKGCSRCVGVKAERQGDGGVQVHGRGTRRPIGRDLMPIDGAPGEGCAFHSQGPGTLPGRLKGRGPPLQQMRSALRVQQRQCRRDEPLDIPEGVPAVARAGECFGSYRCLVEAGCSLQNLEQVEADRQLQLSIPAHFHVRAVPEPVEK